MAKRISNQSSIADVLKEFIHMNKLEKGMDKIDAEQAWRKVMGKGVNNYTQDVILKGTTLYVQLSSATLREELSYGKQKIIEILNEELKREVIKEIVLR